LRHVVGGIPMAPRAARLELPGVPLHVTQRGVNRCAIYHDDHDCRSYRKLLWQACSRHRVSTHAFVLMGNHVHLLLAASEPGAISLAMRQVGQSYAQTFNRRHGRSGTLWQGRFKSCLVGDDRYLLTVMRYIELNPVRAAMVADPADHRWSSVHMHLGACRDPWLTPHPLFLSLGSNADARGELWKRWLQEGIAADDIAAIRRNLAQERALGDARFQTEAEQRLGRPVAYRRPGRPALSPN
jgi:putative transposase